MRILITLLFGVLLILTGVTVFAQDIVVGGKLGIAATFLSSSGWDDVISENEESPGISANNLIAAGFSVGAFAIIDITPTIAFQPELLYSRRTGGIRYEADDSDEETTLRLVQHSIDFPLLVNAGLATGFGRVYGLLGPELSIVLGDVQKKTDNAVSYSSSLETDNSLIFAANIGAGAAFDLDDFSILAELRYNRAFTSAFNDDEEFRSPVYNGIGAFIGAAIPL